MAHTRYIGIGNGYDAAWHGFGPPALLLSSRERSATRLARKDRYGFVRNHRHHIRINRPSIRG